jgi:hypothetical protein
MFYRLSFRFVRRLLFRVSSRKNIKFSLLIFCLQKSRKEIKSVELAAVDEVSPETFWDLLEIACTESVIGSSGRLKVKEMIINSQITIFPTEHGRQDEFHITPSHHKHAQSLHNLL